MERSSAEEASSDEEAGDSWTFGQIRCEDEELEAPAAGDTSRRTSGGIPAETLVKKETERDAGQKPTSDEMLEKPAERDVPSASSFIDTYDPSTSSLSSSYHHHTNSSSSSSSSSVLCLSPPLPPSVELSDVLTDTRLTLDVYQGGAAALPLLWGSVPGQLKGLQYLRLGSEDESGLDDALDVLPHLTGLRSLAIRGHCLFDSLGDPLPGLLTSLPSSFSSLSHLLHLDLSFNQLSSVPSCLLSLPLLSSLLLCHNRISSLPPDIDQLSSLTFLSLLGNKLASLPPSLGRLKSLQTLDVSHNILQQVPDEIGSLGELVQLELSHNMLKKLPESIGSLQSLRKLVINSNDLRVIPQCLNKLPLLKIDSHVQESIFFPTLH